MADLETVATTVQTKDGTCFSAAHGQTQITTINDAIAKLNLAIARANLAIKVDGNGEVVAVYTGHVPTAVLALTQNASAADEVVIGADTYVADTDFSVGADADESLTNLAAAINGNSTGEVVFATNNGDDSMKIEFAAAAGGTPVRGASTSMALTTDITGATWSHGNLNATGRAQQILVEEGSVEIDAVNAAAAFDIELPFTPDRFTHCAYAESGGTYTPKYTTATFVIGSDKVTVTPTAGATALADGDRYIWRAWKTITS